MRIAVSIALAALWLSSPAAAESFPPADESLRYNINWPSGLSLGEAHLTARRTAGQWEFELTLDAAVPGFAVSDRYRSQASGSLCSLEFEKNFTHGRRKAREKTVFDYGKNVARRSTVNGGKTEIPIPACARDALAFIFHARGELSQGRVPPPSTVLFGAAYEVRLDYGGAQAITVNDARVEADRIAVSVKGPASTIGFEIFYARDPVRTPLLVRVPFTLGVFSMELVR